LPVLPPPFPTNHQPPEFPLIPREGPFHLPAVFACLGFPTPWLLPVWPYPPADLRLYASFLHLLADCLGVVAFVPLELPRSFFRSASASGFHLHRIEQRTDLVTFIRIRCCRTNRQRTAFSLDQAVNRDSLALVPILHVVSTSLARGKRIHRSRRSPSE